MPKAIGRQLCALRVATGGVVAVKTSRVRSVIVMAGFGGPEIQRLRIVSFDALFAVLYNEGLPTLGATFAQAPEALQMIRPPEFRAISVTCDSWLVQEAQQKWREIAFGASRVPQKGPIRYLIPDRLSPPLFLSEIQLCDLVNAYSRANCGAAPRQERLKPTTI